MGRFTCDETAAGTHLTKGWLGTVPEAVWPFRKEKNTFLVPGIETGFLVFKPVSLSRYFENVKAALDMSRHYCFTVSCNSAIIFLSKQQTADSLTHSAAAHNACGVVAFVTHMQDGSQRLHKHDGARRVTTSILTSASWSLVRNSYVIIMVVGKNKRCLI